MKLAAASIAALILTGCAVVRYADGERVAIEHEDPNPQELQSKADTACSQSGGMAPAKLISNVSVNPSLPAAMTRKVATFRCTQKP